MPSLRPDVDPDGLLEYSVVYTDRALNHMAARFTRTMQDLSATLKQVYGARSAIVVPGSGSFGMESVARQFAHGKKVLVIRNGWFSYRWSQIFEAGSIPAHTTVLKARPVQAGSKAPYAPAPIGEVVATIRRERPNVVFAPHVELEYEGEVVSLPNQAVIVCAGGILPTPFLKELGIAVETKYGTR